MRTTEIAKAKEELQKDMQVLTQKKAQGDIELRGAKETIQRGNNDMDQLVYELRQIKSAHNLDSWRLGKLKTHNEHLKKQLTEASPLPTFRFSNMLFVFHAFLFSVLC
jgi:hypothetical protein